MRGDGGVAGEGRVVGVYTKVSFCTNTMSCSFLLTSLVHTATLSFKKFPGR